MASWELKLYLVEAMLMAADRPVTLNALAQSLDVTEQEIDAALQEFELDLLVADHGVQVRRLLSVCMVRRFAASENAAASDKAA